MRKHIFMLMLLVGVFFGFSTDTYAIEITETDLFGNVSVLMSCNSENLVDDPNRPSVYSVGIPTLLPNPNIVASKVDGLKDTIENKPIPDGCSFLLIDFGPNWQAVIESDSKFEVFGRYLYVFYGEWSDDFDTVIAGNDYTGSDKTEWSGDSDYHPDSRQFQVHGPYAFMSYDVDADKLYMLENQYNQTWGNMYKITFEGITADTDEEYPNYFPRVITFADRDLSYMQLGSDYLFDDWTNFNWDNDFVGDIDTSTESTDGFWDYITDGRIDAGDNPVMQLFASALEGIGSVVTFVQDLPDLFEDLFSFLPDQFATFLGVCTGIVVALIVLKFALHVLG